MKREHALKLIELLRCVMHSFCPYENVQRYKLLEDLRALETEINLSNDAATRGGNRVDSSPTDCKSVSCESGGASPSLPTTLPGDGK